MKIDKAIGAVKEEQKAGMIQLKMSIRKREKGEEIYEWKQHETWSKRPLRRLSAFLVRVFIY